MSMEVEKKGKLQVPEENTLVKYQKALKNARIK